MILTQLLPDGCLARARPSGAAAALRALRLTATAGSRAAHTTGLAATAGAALLLNDTVVVSAPAEQHMTAAGLVGVTQEPIQALPICVPVTAAQWQGSVAMWAAPPPFAMTATRASSLPAPQHMAGLGGSPAACIPLCRQHAGDGVGRRPRLGHAWPKASQLAQPALQRRITACACLARSEANARQGPVLAHRSACRRCVAQRPSKRHTNAYLNGTCCLHVSPSTSAWIELST